MRLRHLQHLAIAAGLIAAPFLLHGVKDKRELIYLLATLTPYFCFAWVAFLAERMHQRVMVVSAIALSAAYAYAAAAGPVAFAARLPAGERARLLALAIPLTLVALRLVPASWYRGPRLLLPLALASAPLIVAHEIAVRGWGPLRALLHGHAAYWPRALSDLPSAAAPSLALLAAPLAMTRNRTLGVFHRYLIASLVPIYYGLHAQGVGWRWEGTLGFLFAGMVLTYAVFHLFWQKAYVDELMGIANRRALNEKLIELEGKFAVAMVDIDHFKQFNDTFGHEQGDNVLRFVAAQLSGTVQGDIFRYGGEEIAVLFEGRDREFAETAMESARKALADREFHIRSSRLPLRRGKKAEAQRTAGGPSIKVHVTVSVGVAASEESMPRPEDVIIAADSALYRAKQSGRNKVVAYAGGPPPGRTSHGYQ